VPPPSPRPAYLAHARLRRASPIAQYAVAAALEALASDSSLITSGALRLGIIACTMTGGISYSRRFSQEIFQDPATTSPLIFCETVFNAPASHLAAFLGTPAVNYTLVGDAGVFLQGLALAAQWLNHGLAEACVVIGAEESDWTVADALRMFQRRSLPSSGAGALYLKLERPVGNAVELAAVTDVFPITRRTGRAENARKMRAQLPAPARDELLCSSESVNAAWADWTGDRLEPKALLGEAFVASAAWQCVIASGMIRRGRYTAVNVSVTDGGQQAIGARFINSQNQPAAQLAEGLKR
jgi:hypothetical protein